MKVLIVLERLDLFRDFFCFKFDGDEATLDFRATTRGVGNHSTEASHVVMVQPSIQPFHAFQVQFVIVWKFVKGNHPASSV